MDSNKKTNNTTRNKLLSFVTSLLLFVLIFVTLVVFFLISVFRVRSRDGYEWVDFLMLSCEEILTKENIIRGVVFVVIVLAIGYFRIKNDNQDK